MLITKQLTVAIDFHSMGKKILWMSMATVNPLITNILQNLLLCLKKEGILGELSL